MNVYIELVKKWLADPMSVTQAELEANSEAAGYAAVAEIAIADREASGNVDAYSADAYAAAYYASAAHAAANWDFTSAESGVRAYSRLAQLTADTASEGMTS